MNFSSKPIVKYFEHELWHPKNCIINMRPNTRYLFTIMSGFVGVFIIKQSYYYFRNRKELDLNIIDFLSIGGLSGIYISCLACSYNLKFLSLGLFFGLYYGLFYNFCTKFFVNRKKNRAAKIGIEI
jgi:hypothetical protein